MSRREQLLDLLVASTTVSRERLQRSSTDELEEALSKSLLNGIRNEVLNSPEILAREQEIEQINADRQRMAQENALSNIFRIPVNGKVAIDNQANRSIISGWLQEDQREQISPAWFTKVLSEQPQLASSLSWRSADILDPKKREAVDRDTFNRFARENGFSEVAANYQLAKSVLGDGLDRHLLAQAVESNALQLAPAPRAELAKFRKEFLVERQDYLVNQASPEELRQAARTESEQSRIQAQDQHAIQQIKTRQQAEVSFGHPVLPEANSDGVKLDDVFFKKLADSNIKMFRQYCTKFGFAAITARLNQVR